MSLREFLFIHRVHSEVEEEQIEREKSKREIKLLVPASVR